MDIIRRGKLTTEPVEVCRKGRHRGNIMRRITLIVTLIAAGAGFGHAQTFQKVKMIDARDQEVAAELTLDQTGKRLSVKPAKGEAVEVPYCNIDKLAYERSAHHRVKQGAIVMVASLGAGAIVMATKSKNHWFYVDYKDAGGASKGLVLKLDKSDYEKILQLAKDQTGKDVETLRSQEGVKRPK